MEPPVCKICGKRHWSRLCEPVTRTVTEPGPVTRIVTGCPNCKLLEAEITWLKRQLSEVNGVKPLAMTGAQRVAKLRAKRKGKP